MQRYGDVAHLPMAARIESDVRRRARAGVAVIRRLVPGSAQGHVLRWEDRRGWVIRPASGVRSLAIMSPAATNTGIDRTDRDGADGWAADWLDAH